MYELSGTIRSRRNILKLISFFTSLLMQISLLLKICHSKCFYEGKETLFTPGLSKKKTKQKWFDSENK